MILALVGMGCAVLGGMSDTDLVCDVMTQWNDAMKAGDVDAVMALYSEDYEGWRGTGIEELRERFDNWVPRMAEAEESAFDLSEAVPIVEENTATFSPVIFRMRDRSLRIQYTLTKEADGVWRISGTGRAESDDE
jgi:ketosteroid isomerase-like protein